MNTFKAYRIHSNPNQIHSGFEMLELDDLTSGNVIIKSVYSSINYKDALAATHQSTILKKIASSWRYRRIWCDREF